MQQASLKKQKPACVVFQVSSGSVRLFSTFAFYFTHSSFLMFVVSFLLFVFWYELSTIHDLFFSFEVRCFSKAQRSVYFFHVCFITFIKGKYTSV